MKKIVMVAGVLAAVTFTLNAAADDCSLSIESNDQMKFNTSEIVLPKSCEEVSITLTHTGKLPKAVMGHNIVITQKSDEADTIRDGGLAGAASHYVKEDDERVIASSELIGGGESTTFTIKPSDLKPEQDYTFFCSFPGHAALMKGTVKVEG